MYIVIIILDDNYYYIIFDYITRDGRKLNDIILLTSFIQYDDMPRIFATAIGLDAFNRGYSAARVESQ